MPVDVGGAHFCSNGHAVSSVTQGGKLHFDHLDVFE